jgi:IS4 transposase
MFKTSPADCSHTFFSRLNAAARKTKFIVRSTRKFSAAGYLLALLNAVLTGRASFNQLAMTLKDSEPLSLSKQAFWKRTNSFAVAFMLEALTLAIIEKWHRDPPQIARLKKHFKRVLVEDSTQQKLPKSNHENFPAHGNGQSVTAGMKVDLTVDLIHGRAVSSQLHGATEQDRDLGKNLVDLVKKRDLVLRDRGYFSLGEFALIDKKGAYWLSRVPSNLIIKDEDGNDLDKHLENAPGKLVEMKVQLGGEEYGARLVAVRATPAVAEKALREAREKAQKSGRTLTKSQRLRCHWHLIVTNIPEQKLNARALAELYRCRWNIEIIFRAWKQSANLAKALNRRSNEDHFQCLMLAGMIYQVLSLRMVSLMRTLISNKRISLEKLFDSFSSHLTKCRKLEDLWTHLPDPRHITMETRKDRRPLEDTWIKLLS